MLLPSSGSIVESLADRGPSIPEGHPKQLINRRAESGHEVGIPQVPRKPATVSSPSASRSLYERAAACTKRR